ncbi:MAG: hypothetical protein AB1758_37450, partial [Candidatus Eremiobacterota bacterium]
MDFPLLILTSELENGVLVTRALNFPELDRLGYGGRRATGPLVESLEHRLKDLPDPELFRRLPPERVDPLEVELSLAPKKPDVHWNSPVQLRFRAVVWERSGLVVASLPDLGIEVAAEDLEELARRAPEHALGELMRRESAGSLERLVWLQRTRQLEVATAAA